MNSREKEMKLRPRQSPGPSERKIVKPEATKDSANKTKQEVAGE